MGHKKYKTYDQWLSLLAEAMNEGVAMQVNHRFRYKDKNLGTFLVKAKRSNNPELLKKIEELGLDFKKHSHNPEDGMEIFTNEVLPDFTYSKTRFQTKFNQYILPKKDILKRKSIQKFNKAWLKRFKEVRSWNDPLSPVEKVRDWKIFRYNTYLNPEGKWYLGKTHMGKIHSWVYNRKMAPEKMEAVIEYFNPTEIKELKSEGFF
jgi:hypothetical protein